MSRLAALAASAPGWPRIGLLGAVSVAVLGFLQHQPVAPLAVGLGLLLAALLVAWRPMWLWLIVPATLPALDLAPWTGRLFVDEFDALLALLLAVAWARTPAARAATAAAPTQAAGDTPLRLAVLAVLISLLIGVARALNPWPGLDANAFVNLTSPFNALRLARGAVWGLLLWQLARRQQAAGGDVARAMGGGLVLGLLATVVVVAAERISFSHWLDVADGYRVAGPFAAMNVGGAYVECFLVTALPFLLARLWPPVPAWRLLAGGGLLLGALYAVMVTFSRSGYAALVIVLGVSVAGNLHGRGAGTARRVAGAVLALTSATVVLPVLLGEYAQSRLATVDRDLVTRQQHWRHALSLVEPDLVSQWLGMGLGRFAALDLLRSPPPQRSASWRLVDGDGPRHLQLGTGKALYIEQMVGIRPEQAYRLTLRVRAAAPGATLAIALCEKWLVTSAHCVRASAGRGLATGGWLELGETLNSAAVGASSPGRPVVLSISASGSAAVDVQAIQLTDGNGNALLQNSRFEQGMDHWYFSSDHHLAWHTKSLPLALYVDLGLFGLVSMAGLLALALKRSAGAAWRGAPGAVPLLAALLGFITVGAVDTLIDAPRFLMLWLLLCCLAASPGGWRPVKTLN